MFHENLYYMVLVLLANVLLNAYATKPLRLPMRPVLLCVHYDFNYGWPIFMLVFNVLVKVSIFLP